MFRFITTLAQNASEILAPNLKPEEELFLQWHNFVKELKSRNGSLISVDDTDIPLKLQWVFNLIQQEIAALPVVPVASSSEDGPSRPTDAGDSSHGIGPCLEMALRYKMFDWLVALAKTDKPSGIKGYVLFFITNLLKAPNITALLPKSFMYKPLSRLVQCCGSSTCSPWDREELGFLLGVIHVLQQDPCLANLFLRTYSHEPIEKMDTDLTRFVVPQNPFLSDMHRVESEGALNGSSEAFAFPLLDSLFRLAINPDSDISPKARNAAVDVLKIRETVVCASIQSSKSFAILIRHLLKFYDAIPLTPETLENLSTTNASDSAENALRPLLSWIAFVDQIFLAAEEELAEKLRDTIQHDLLRRSVFAEDWCSSAADRNSKAMAVFLRMYKATESLGLLTLWAEVFLNDRLLAKFFACLSDSDSCLLGFDVVEYMMLKPPFHLVDELLLKYLGTRLYIRKDLRMHESRKEEHVTEAADRAAMFRDLFPTAAKSCTIVEEEIDRDNYVRESHYSMVAVMQRCQHLLWPTFGSLKPCNILLAEESAFFDGHAFNEGPLLRLLFTRLSQTFTQPYNVNLRITGILSKICLLPNPVIREFLLDPTVPLSSQSMSLYRCLMNLVQKMDEYFRLDGSLRDKVLRVRQEIKNKNWTNVSRDSDSVIPGAVVILEEFCKEIAARAYVRFQ